MIGEVRSLSSLVFGHRYRLELVAALAIAGGDEGICLTLLGSLCGVSPSVYYPPLKVLVAGGLVRRMTRTRDDPYVLYSSTPAPAWTGLQRLVEDLEVDVELRRVARRRAAA